ncbi:MAG: tRNA epoxyqueuosine(34) reductase QueG [Planctomycetota bacterium]
MLERCRELGFALAGVARVGPMRHADEMREWLAQGKHGSMAYLAEHAKLKADASQMLEGARCAIMVADLYATRNEPTDPVPNGHGRIARYARGGDYHKAIKKRLHRLCDEMAERFAECQTRAFVDTAPVHERELALAAGLGWVGKHTLMIHPRVGSWMLLGGVLTTLDLEVNQREEPDHCGTCTRCIDACPTDAITPYSVDASRCVSYLTIERREAIAADLQRGIGEWVFGCDICQEVCPHNSPREGDVGQRSVAYEPGRASFDLVELLGWDEEARRVAFAGTALKRAKLGMMKRNAVIAAGNAVSRMGLHDPTSRVLLDALGRIRASESEEREIRSLADRTLAGLSDSLKDE